jgi:hypothetical protein
VVEHKLGTGIVLGERGKGRWEELVRLSRRNPPTVEDDKVLHADVERFSVGETQRLSLVREANRVDLLVRVDSDGPYTRGCDGAIGAYWGKPQKLAGGYRAWGAAGRVGQQPDELWLLRPGEAIYCTTAGGSKSVGLRIIYCDTQSVPLVLERDEFLLDFCSDISELQRGTALALAIERGQKKLVEFLSATPKMEVVS